MDPRRSYGLRCYETRHQWPADGFDHLAVADPCSGCDDLTPTRCRRTSIKLRFISRNGNSGFGLIEIMLVLVLGGILAGMSLIGMNAVLPAMNANRSMYAAVSQLRRGRNLAISQRRPITLRLVPPDRIQLVRNEWPTGTTDLGSALLGNRARFQWFAGVPDTPDGFGNAGAVDFGAAGTLTFLTDGTLVDDSGHPVNGSIFIGIDGHSEVARAVTVLGATGRIRSYRWTGAEWIQ